MSQERRRYFRINETLGIAWQVLEVPDKQAAAAREPSQGPLERLHEHDEQLQRLLNDVAQSHPKVAELVALLNKKLDRVVSQIMVENRLVDRIARRVKEANISACGIAFSNDEPVPLEALLKLELTLYPEETKLAVRGKVVGCDPTEDRSGYYWRIDFQNMSEQIQEQLIQHIVKRQSAQLKRLRME